MQPIGTTPPARWSLASTAILTLMFAVALGVLGLPGSAAARQAPRARSAGACDGTATLGLSDSRPRQLRPVRFSATKSTVPAGAVAFYDFNYGDGSDDAGAQPTAVHAYQSPGIYAAKLSIVTTCNTIVSSADYRVVVLDGLPPMVAIGLPRPNQVAHFGPAGLLLSGSAHDPSGVRRVELAIQLLSVKRSATRTRAAHPARAGKRPAAVTGPACYWYDGHFTLRARGCATPLFFSVPVSVGRWSFRMNPRSQIPPGVYTARVRATDRAGNTSTIFSPTLGNIIAFHLVP